MSKKATPSAHVNVDTAFSQIRNKFKSLDIRDTSISPAALYFRTVLRPKERVKCCGWVPEERGSLNYRRGGLTRGPRHKSWRTQRLTQGLTLGKTTVGVREGIHRATTTVVKARSWGGPAWYLSLRRSWNEEHHSLVEKEEWARGDQSIGKEVMFGDGAQQDKRKSRLGTSERISSPDVNQRLTLHLRRNPSMNLSQTSILFVPLLSRDLLSYL